MKRTFFVPVLIVAFSAMTFVSCGQFKAKVEIKKANELYNAKKYEEAIKHYRQALKYDKKIDTIHLNMALTYMALYVPGSTHPKDVEYANQAIAQFKEYLKNHPDDPKVNEYLITMFLNAERTDDAIAYFENHLKKNPNDTSTMQKLAFIYAKSGKFDEALKWYQRRTQVEPNNPEAFYVIGVICWEKSYKFADVTPEERQRLIQLGMDALDRAVKLNPKYAEAYLYMNLLYREKAKMISPDPNLFPVPDDKIDEYNAYLQKAKELQDKAVEIRKQQTPS
jgi:tetratricopeptide (TPR) repeat protein